MNLTSETLEKVKGIGPQRRQLLEKLGIFSIEDLLLYPPKRYEDRRVVKSIDQLQEGEGATVCGVITGLSAHRRGRLRIFQMRIKQNNLRLTCTWFNQNYLKNNFNKKQTILVTGKIRLYKGIEPQMVNPEYEVLSSEEGEEKDFLHMGRIVPIYPLTEGISQKVLRTLIFQAIEENGASLHEILPESWRCHHGWMGRQEAIRELHFPKEPFSWQKARERLAYEEFLVLQLGILNQRREMQFPMPTIPSVASEELEKKFIQQLPFALTSAQRRVLKEIHQDMVGKKPMNRLLQGDVGSGKTVVAMVCMVKALGWGLQCALMAPTEILAQQHYFSFKRWFEPLGLSVGLLRSEMDGVEKRELLGKIKAGAVPCVIGTHALIQQNVRFRSLGLVVIDEQHKFGVMQRALLRQKGNSPHVLLMTATPIPRTLALTLYGDMDVSLLDELPPGKAQITTRWVTEKKLPQVISWLRQRVQQGEQAYALYPLIEESDKVEWKSALSMFDKWRQGELKGLRIGLLHGRLPVEEKEHVMSAFKKGELDVLVSTTVIEVGIDVPRATIMLIENAERFGLAQLHQLRGRVGRGTARSYCVLVGSPKTQEGKKRLQTMVATQDGFQIAEEDLRLRGPGEFFGLRQHGLLLLRLGDLVSDLPLVELARSHARELLTSGALFTPQWALLVQEVNRGFGFRLALAQV